MSGRIESSRNHNGTSEDVTNYVCFGFSDLVAMNQVSNFKNVGEFFSNLKSLF